MLHMQVKVHSPNSLHPPPQPLQSGTSQWVSCHRTRPAAAVRYTLQFDWLTTNCQRPLTPDISVAAAQSVAGYKWLMLAETVAQTDGWHRQILPIISIWWLKFVTSAQTKCTRLSGPLINHSDAATWSPTVIHKLTMGSVERDWNWMSLISQSFSQQ